MLFSVLFQKYKCMLFWLKLPTSSYAMYCFEMILDTVPNAMRGRLTGTGNCDSAKVCEGRNSNKPTANTLKCFDRKHCQHSHEKYLQISYRLYFNIAASSITRQTYHYNSTRHPQGCSLPLS